MKKTLALLFMLALIVVLATACDVLSTQGGKGDIDEALPHYQWR